MSTQYVSSSRLVKITMWTVDSSASCWLLYNKSRCNWQLSIQGKMQCQHNLLKSPQWGPHYFQRTKWTVDYSASRCLLYNKSRKSNWQGNTGNVSTKYVSISSLVKITMWTVESFASCWLFSRTNEPCELLITLQQEQARQLARQYWDDAMSTQFLLQWVLLTSLVVQWYTAAPTNGTKQLILHLTKPSPTHWFCNTMEWLALQW